MDFNNPYPNLDVYQKENLNNSELQPRPIVSILIASVFILINYSIAFIFVATFSTSNLTIKVLLVAVPLLLNFFLSVAAVAGWNPRKIRFLRVVLMFFLTIFPVFLWIPSYLAGKAFARKKLNQLIPNPSRFPLVVFGLISDLISVNRKLLENVDYRIKHLDEEIRAIRHTQSKRY